MNSNDPRSSDFSYKKYSLEQLDNWVNDAVNCEDLTPQDIYETIVKCVDESVEYHKKYFEKSTELLSLLKGNRVVPDLSPELQAIKEAGGFEWTPDVPKINNANQKDWNDFWEEHYYPEEHSSHYYDYNRNDPNRKNPFTIPDYTEL